MQQCGSELNCGKEHKEGSSFFIPTEICCVEELVYLWDVSVTQLQWYGENAHTSMHRNKFLQCKCVTSTIWKRFYSFVFCLNVPSDAMTCWISRVFSSAGHTPICSVCYFAQHWSVHALLLKAAAWVLRSCVFLYACLWPVFTCNLSPVQCIFT